MNKEVNIVRLNRSFSRRIGKTLSTLQKELLETELPKYLFDENKIPLIPYTAKSDVEIFLEIGFGMGEHFVHQVGLKPEALFIGVEVYLNGVANVLKLAKEQDINNFLLWPDDLDLMLTNLPNGTLSGIYILFPDPWPKRHQQKKRILNEERLNILRDKLKKGGFLIFASDIEDYFQASSKLIMAQQNFQLVNDNMLTPHDNYITTKYHQKAQREGRVAKFLKTKQLQ